MYGFSNRKSLSLQSNQKKNSYYAERKFTEGAHVMALREFKTRRSEQIKEIEETSLYCTLNNFIQLDSKEMFKV